MCMSIYLLTESCLDLNILNIKLILKGKSLCTCKFSCVNRKLSRLPVNNNFLKPDNQTMGKMSCQFAYYATYDNIITLLLFLSGNLKCIIVGKIYRTIEVHFYTITSSTIMTILLFEQCIQQ